MNAGCVRGCSLRSADNVHAVHKHKVLQLRAPRNGLRACRATEDDNRYTGWWPLGSNTKMPALPPPPPPPRRLPPPPPPPPQQQQAAAQQRAGQPQPPPGSAPPPDPWSAQQQESSFMKDALGGRSKWDLFNMGASTPRQQPGAADPWAQRPKPGTQKQQAQQRQARPPPPPQGRQQGRAGSEQARRQAQQSPPGAQSGWQSFNSKLYDLTQESNPQWRWPSVGGDQGSKDLSERIARIKKRIEDEARKDEVVLPPDFDNLDPRQYSAEMQRYIEYRRKARAEKDNQANDLEISGLAWVYVGIMVLVLVGSATLPTSW